MSLREASVILIKKGKYSIHFAIYELEAMLNKFRCGGSSG
jgi:hypothetical protein